MKLDENKKSFARYLRKASTNAEQLLWYQLRGRRFSGIKFRRQQPIKKYIVDFVSFEKKLIIEIDGGQHNTANNVLRDNHRTEELKQDGFVVLRFWNNEVLRNLEGVLERIQQTLTLTLSRKRGEGINNRA